MLANGPLGHDRIRHAGCSPLMTVLNIFEGSPE
jgi:hypothetical protein